MSEEQKKKPKKQRPQKREKGDQDEGHLYFYLEYATDFKEVRLRVVTEEPITGEEYLDMLDSFIEDCRPHQDQLFDDLPIAEEFH